MAKKVTALTSMAGDYGFAKEGDELEVSDSLAKELESKGLVKVGASTSTDEKAEGFRASNLTTAKEQEKGLRIKDETIKSGKTGAEGETDAKNPTGKKPAAAKKSSGKK